MHRRYNLAHLILAGVVVLGLTLLMVAVDAQAQIAFVSERDGNHEIYVMDVDGKNQRRLTNNVWEDWFPSWSPDGERIVFSSVRDGNFRNDFGITDEIYVMDADGSNQQRLTENLATDWYPSWSPDGDRIVFASKVGWGKWEIYVMDADGKNQQNLTETEDGQNDRDPSWSPDGDRIAFTSERDGNFEIYVMDANGKNQRNLIKSRQNDSSPSWSPDGDRIAFTSNRTGNYDIYVMDADGGNQRRLTKNRQDDFRPAWFDSAFAVAPVGKILTTWGWLKQVAR